MAIGVKITRRICNAMTKDFCLNESSSAKNLLFIAIVFQNAISVSLLINIRV